MKKIGSTVHEKVVDCVGGKAKDEKKRPIITKTSNGGVKFNSHDSLSLWEPLNRTK